MILSDLPDIVRREPLLLTACGGDGVSATALSTLTNVL
jgi:hypothetical protein